MTVNVAPYITGKATEEERAAASSALFRTGSWGRAWLKTPCMKNVYDLWTYQEIISYLKPDVIVEIGTYHGASAHFLAVICGLIGHGRVVTIDVKDIGEPVPHPRLTYVLGNSTHIQTRHIVHDWAGGQRGMVILDGAHDCESVLSDLLYYSAFVAPKQYLVVEDTNVNGHPDIPEYGPGPWEAVEQFMSYDPPFVVDTNREPFATFNPRGYLRRL